MRRRIAVVRSDTGRGRYVVSRHDGTDLWECSCPAWVKHRGPREACKHVLRVRLWIKDGCPDLPIDSPIQLESGMLSKLRNELPRPRSVNVAEAQAQAVAAERKRVEDEALRKKEEDAKLQKELDKAGKSRRFSLLEID